VGYAKPVVRGRLADDKVGPNALWKSTAAMIRLMPGGMAAAICFSTHLHAGKAIDIEAGGLLPKKHS